MRNYYMTKIQASCVSLLVVAMLVVGVSVPKNVFAGTDTYPAPWAPPTAQDSMLDTWKEYNRECTSYVAWMLHSVNGYEMPFYDDAVNWGTDAENLGITVNMTPAVGSIFWSTSHDHVAYVESVNTSAGTITTEDYNSGYPTNPGWWAEHTGVAISSASGYIHFKDVGSSGNPSTTPKVTPLQYGGEMDIFKRGSDNAIWKDTIQSGSSSWGGWNSLSGVLASNPSADQYGSEMDVFATNAAGNLYQDTYQPSTESWGGWTMRASNMAGDPYSIVYDGNLYVYSRGTDGNLYVIYWNGSSWVGPSEIAGNGSTAMGSSPTATVYGSEMDVYMRGTDSNLWKSGNTNGTVWGTFSSMGGSTLENDPKAITYGSEMDVYVNDTTGTLEKDTWNGSTWSGFNSLTGANFSGSPTALQYGSGEMDVYDRGSSNSYIYKDTWQAGGTSWSGWNSLGGNEQGNPTALQWGTEMDVYATNYANNTDKDTWLPANDAWSGFTSLL